jgi:GH24 family phage-related lysozyme (muramidase)
MLATSMLSLMLAAVPSPPNDHLAMILAYREGYSDQVYHDGTRFAIGFGHQCAADHPPMDEREAERLLHEDIGKARRVIPDLDTHPPGVIMACEAMAFQLGPQGLLSFRNFRAYLARRDYPRAAGEMVNSRWHTQTPDRCQELAHMVATAKAL